MRRRKKIKKILVLIGKPVYLLSRMIIKFLGWVTRVFEGNWHWAAFSLLLLSLTGVGWWGYEKILRDLPNVNQIYAPPSLSSKIRDRNGRLLYKFYKE